MISSFFQYFNFLIRLKLVLCVFSFFISTGALWSNAEDDENTYAIFLADTYGDDQEYVGTLYYGVCAKGINWHRGNLVAMKKGGEVITGQLCWFKKLSQDLGDPPTIQPCDVCGELNGDDRDMLNQVLDALKDGIQVDEVDRQRLEQHHEINVELFRRLHQLEYANIGLQVCKEQGDDSGV